MTMKYFLAEEDESKPEELEEGRIEEDEDEDEDEIELKEVLVTMKLTVPADKTLTDIESSLKDSVGEFDFVHSIIECNVDEVM